MGLALGIACAPAAAPVVTPRRPPPVASSAAPKVEPTGGCPDRIAAINLAHEGDQRVKVDVEGALEKYSQALQLDPANYVIYWKQSLAYDKMERWDAAAASAQRALLLAPDFANHAHQLGKVLLEQAKTDPAAYEQAREPLIHCIQRDPNYADCYYLLGQVEEWSDHPDAAAWQYGAAIRHDSSRAHYYRRLAELYVTFRHAADAEAVLNLGVQLAPSLENARELGPMFVMQAELRHARRDAAGELSALEHAEKFVETDPAMLFALGSRHATFEPLNAARKQAAVRLLMAFVKRVCRGSGAAQYKEQCETAQSMLQRLGQ